MNFLLAVFGVLLVGWFFGVLLGEVFLPVAFEILKVVWACGEWVWRGLQPRNTR